jgi:hypothetical protein
MGGVEYSDEYKTAVEAIGVVFAVMGLIGGAVDEGAHCLNKSHQTMNWPRKDYVGQ